MRVPEKAILLCGSIAALCAGLGFRRNLSAEYDLCKTLGLFRQGPDDAPSGAVEWFALAAHSKPYTFLLLNGFDLVNSVLLLIMYAAVFSIIGKNQKMLASVAMLLVALGAGLHLATFQYGNMAELSRAYYAAASEIQQAEIIGLGDRSLAIWNDFTAYATGKYYPFGLLTAGGLLFSIGMLISKTFSKGVSILGVMGMSIGLSFYLIYQVKPDWIALPIAGSAPFLMGWYLWIGLVLYGKYKHIQAPSSNIA